MSNTTSSFNFRSVTDLGLATLLAMTLSGCGSNNVAFEKSSFTPPGSSRAGDDNGSSSNPPGGGGDPGCTSNCKPPEAASEGFVQNEPENTVDILIVIDNSPSMDAVQAKVAAGFSSLIGAIKNLDWQISFTTTQINQYNGHLASLVGTSGQILKKGTAKASDIFRDTIASFGTLGSGDERGVYAANSTVLLGNGANKDFFRKNSALAVVVVSDEDERSTGGLNLLHNQNGSSGPIETEDMPSTLVSSVKTTLGRDKKFSGYGIVVPSGNTRCYNEATQGFYGTFYESLASSTGGKVGSICDADYSVTLSGIGQNIQNLINSVTLNHVPIVNTIRVTLSPAQAGITWTAQGDKIIFSNPPAPGSRITVAYYWQP